MAIYIERLNIDCFRGIQGLILDNLNHVNIIAGDNNSGKTSVLEAMLLLRNPKEFNNILRISRNRDMSAPFCTVPIYENFMNLFPRTIYQKEISVNGICMGRPVVCRLTGWQKSILLAPEDLPIKHRPFSGRERFRPYPETPETDAFIGDLYYDIGRKQGFSEIMFHTYSRTTGREFGRDNYINIIYLSPTDHLRGNIINKIIRDDLYKDICLNVLRLFDPEIIDLLYLKNEDSSRPIEYIKHAALGSMPVSTYGDGIKKVLSLANGIAQAANGILMIDELETAIHSKYYDDIFRFIVKACMQFQVQVFITTHSMEAIDGLLATQDYDTQDSDDISVITFKKDSDNNRTYSRILPGRRVYSNREEFGFEVRL